MLTGNANLKYDMWLNSPQAPLCGWVLASCNNIIIIEVL